MIRFDVPPDVFWPAHRVATSRRYTDPLHTILTAWSLDQVYDACDVLDAIEGAEAEAMER